MVVRNLKMKICLAGVGVAVLIIIILIIYFSVGGHHSSGLVIAKILKTACWL